MSPDLLAGRYELTERIAGGGMGQVWRGRDRVLERIVAVKTVDLSTQDATARERFRREAVATAGLSAPNIVQVYDAGVDGRLAYLVMELLTGPTLSQLIHDYGPLDVNEGVHVSLEVAKGLLAAHRIGVVHRDIKPGNVMFHHDQVKLVDFGIAQLARNMGAALTAPATALGTAAYMSPEQATGEGATEKSDWYALGCLMTTIFTGTPPFQGEALAVASQQINSKPPYLSERRAEIPVALDQLVARLLAKEPDERPTGEEVVEQLRQLRVDPNAGTTVLPAGAPTASATAVLPGGTHEMPQRASFPGTPSEPPPPVRPVAPPPPQRVVPDQDRRRRSPWPLLLVSLLVLALGLVGAFFLFGDGSGGTQAPPASPSPRATTTTTEAPTTTRPPTTRRSTTTRPPTTTQAPTTTRPPTTSSAPTETSTSGGGSGNQGNGNSRGNGNSDQGSGDSGNATPAAVQSAIDQVDSRPARSLLTALWTEAQITGDDSRMMDATDQLENQRLITKSESRAVQSALKEWRNA